MLLIEYSNNKYRIRASNSLFLRKDGTIGHSDKFDMAFDWYTSEEANYFLAKWLNGVYFASDLRAFHIKGSYGCKIDWLSLKYIKEQAQKGDKEALNCSILHWKQIVIAGYDIFVEESKRGNTDINGNYCALCHRDFEACEKCPIFSKTRRRHCSGSPCIEVHTAYAGKNAQAFESAAIKELNFLMEIRNEIYGNPYIEINKNLDERIAQCIEDKETIEKNLKNLQEQKKIDHFWKEFGLERMSEIK